MDVGAYNREVCVFNSKICALLMHPVFQSRAVITYQLILTITNNPRRAKMQMPESGSNIAVRGILSDINIHEGFPGVELERITYLPRT